MLTSNAKPAEQPSSLSATSSRTKSLSTCHARNAPISCITFSAQSARRCSALWITGWDPLVNANVGSTVVTLSAIIAIVPSATLRARAMKGSPGAALNVTYLLISWRAEAATTRCIASISTQRTLCTVPTPSATLKTRWRIARNARRNTWILERQLSVQGARKKPTVWILSNCSMIKCRRKISQIPKLHRLLFPLRNLWTSRRANLSWK